MVLGSGQHHSIEEVLAAFPARAGASAPQHRPDAAVRPAAAQPRGGTHRASGEASAVLAAFRGLRVVRWAMENPEDLSREAWRGLATNIAAVVLDDEALHAAGADLFHEISQLDLARHSAAECDRAFRDALRSARDFGPMTFARLEEAGVPADACVGAQLAKAPVGVARLLAARGRRAGVA
jgi:hypothetical protein